MILGISGGMRSRELYNINVNDVEDTGEMYRVTVRGVKSGDRQVLIDNQYYDTVARYIGLRLPLLREQNFFLVYNQGRCGHQKMGIKAIKNVAPRIASFLNLPNSVTYFGRPYRPQV